MTKPYKYFHILSLVQHLIRFFFSSPLLFLYISAMKCSKKIKNKKCSLAISNPPSGIIISGYYLSCFNGLLFARVQLVWGIRVFITRFKLQHVNLYYHNLFYFFYFFCCCVREGRSRGRKLRVFQFDVYSRVGYFSGWVYWVLLLYCQTWLSFNSSS